MAVYEYLAKDINGRRIRGEVRAADETKAWEELRSLGVYPVKLKEIRGKMRKRPMGFGLLASFSGELSAMLHSGIPLAQAMNMMSVKEIKPDLKEVYKRLYHLLLHGMDLSGAMELQGGIFPPFTIHMVRAGEAEGNLAQTSEEMAVYYEKEERMLKKIMAAMTYPAFLLLTIILSLLILFTKVLPEFFGLFDSMETLPHSTRILMKVSGWISSNLPEFVVAFGIVVIVFMCFYTQPEVRVAKDRMMLHVPIVGRLYRTICTARFARTFRSLYAGGVPVVKALELTSSVMGNEYIKSRFVQVIEDVSNGMLLSEALSDIGELDHELVSSLYIGEETGRLNCLLEDIADVFDSRAENAAGRLLTLIEPVLIVLMAVIIGYVMLAVMVPVYQYYRTIG